MYAVARLVQAAAHGRGADEIQSILQLEREVQMTMAPDVQVAWLQYVNSSQTDASGCPQSVTYCGHHYSRCV